MPSQERIQIFVANERLLLDDLRIDIGRSQGFDLGNEEIPNPFDSLSTRQHSKFLQVPYRYYLIRQIVQQRLDIGHG